MRHKEVQQLMEELQRVYDPATKERYNKTHKPLFSKKSEEKKKDSPVSLNGSIPATIAQIRQVLYKREDDI